MTKPGPIKVDRRKGCFVVEVLHEFRGTQHLYVVKLGANERNSQFDVLEVRNKTSGGLVKNSVRGVIGEKAIKHMFRSIREKSKRQPRPTFSLTERIERSTVLTLVEWDAEGRTPGKFTAGNMRGLYDCMRLINDEIGILKDEAERTSNPLPTDYFQYVKRSQLVKLRKRHRITNKMRDFYSSVLTRAYAWKNGVIPEKELKVIEKHLPGFRLMITQD